MSLGAGVGVAVGISYPELRHVMGTDWRGNARCAKLPKSVFFEYNGIGMKKQEKQERIWTAKETCKACPVRSQCYEFAVLNSEPHGIWAGTFPDERRKLYLSFLKTGILEPL